MTVRGRDGVQLVEHLAFKKPRVWSPAPHKPDMVVHACNLSVWAVGPEKSEGKRHPQMQRKFEDRLGYIRLWK